MGSSIEREGGRAGGCTRNERGSSRRAVDISMEEERGGSAHRTRGEGRDGGVHGERRGRWRRACVWNERGDVQEGYTRNKRGRSQRGRVQIGGRGTRWGGTRN